MIITYLQMVKEPRLSALVLAHYTQVLPHCAGVRIQGNGKHARKVRRVLRRMKR